MAMLEKQPNRILARGGAGGADAATFARRRAISLAEMMIAIIILGLGLIMVATLFPVSWTRARQLAEFTSQNNATAAAETAVRVVAQVDGSQTDQAGFKGDQLNIAANNIGFRLASARVYAMNMENIRLENRAFQAENPYQLDPNDPVRGNLDYEETLRGLDSSYFQPEVLFYDRVYPPMAARQDELDFNVDDPAWDAALDSRRFCWTAFHKLSLEYVNDVNAALPRGALIDVTRNFTMYYVTLRRPRPSLRYARQAHGDARALPDINDRARIARVAPLPSREDVMFPVPWRVQITLPSAETIYCKDNPLRTGVPTEVAVNVNPQTMQTESASLAYVSQMFRRGTMFIDELSGQVYRVEKVRPGGNFDEQAWLTLDREIVREDIDDLNTDCSCGYNAKPDCLEDGERVRAVWVFPPPVRPERIDNGQQLVFDGAQPVVGIDVRSLEISPR